MYQIFLKKNNSRISYYFGKMESLKISKLKKKIGIIHRKMEKFQVL